MAGYVPHTDDERQKMLARVGVNSLDDLYRSVPPEMMLQKLNLPEGLNEMGAARAVRDMAAKNTVFRSIFRGAGAYNHYIPAIVKSVTSKEEFVTAYTPYQAEISQGVLQSIFEYQTMICELTGMDVSNASVYDGATAAAEAIHMCVDKKRPTALIADNVRPMTIQTVKTYMEGSDTKLVIVPTTDGRVDQDKLLEALDGGCACFYMEQPSYYGLIEDAEGVCDMVHAAGAKLIVGVNPIACALLKTPGEIGADVCVGEGQPLGLPLAFGGPYLGFMACTQAMVRRLPGRIVGQTQDKDGNRAFVLTLQAREQHIRREKASSNICSNQALCAMTAAVYMAAMGPDGMREVARQCHAKAAYLASELYKIKGFAPANEGEFFNEFASTCPISAQKLIDALAEKGILGGLVLENNTILWCATEMNAKPDIDQLIETIKEAVR